MKTAVASPPENEIVVRVETLTGIEDVVIDLAEDLGEITQPEAALMAAYALQADLPPDRAWAGAHILVQLSRRVDLDPKTLLEAVL
jgi:hypothetical protein